MRILERVELYRRLALGAKAEAPVAKAAGALSIEGLAIYEQIEILRELATDLTQVYKVTIPTVTFFVRDSSYCSYTDEIFLGSINLKAFLREYRFHLQNEARKYDKRYLLLDGREDLDVKIPFKDAESLMYGADDAEAWAVMLIENINQRLEVE